MAPFFTRGLAAFSKGEESFDHRVRGFPGLFDAVTMVTDACVTCHTLRLGADSPVGEDFLASVPVQSLGALEHARLQIALRRFDDALARYAPHRNDL